MAFYQHVFSDSSAPAMFSLRPIARPLGIDDDKDLKLGHWSVVKYRGQGQPGQDIKLFQITLYVNDFQTLNNPGS